ncbi:hypothetical protein T440DRAFT_165865 [Plenodomus tracheiphilus IPT5]|uniref:Uncharacterized protein n=1 Tax=Plenodomus tracheiphilus IPT5 TaxID=1408161 RepID=A0A6A7BKH1_9PLEO|nr:hypothetical protein T440DRAFT_165865 [Plenodomus tracheiphilus IPT5]
MVAYRKRCLWNEFSDEEYALGMSRKEFDAQFIAPPAVRQAIKDESGVDVINGEGREGVTKEMWERYERSLEMNRRENTSAFKELIFLARDDMVD